MENKITNGDRSGIYKITNLKNGKIYIGKSKNIFSRWKNHLFELDTNHHGNAQMQRDFQNHGVENFIFQVLEILDEKDLDSREIFYIDQFNSTNQDIGYNIMGKNMNVEFDANLNTKFNLTIHLMPHGMKKIEPKFREKNHLFSLAWYRKKTKEELVKYGFHSLYYYKKIKEKYDIESIWTCPINYYNVIVPKGMVKRYIEPDCMKINENKYQSIYFAHNIYPNCMKEKNKDDYTKKFLINFIENNCDTTKEIHVCSPSLRMINILKELSINEQ